MSKIDDMIANLLKHEGGYVNHKADKGGPTNFGITQATYSRYLGRQASIADVRNMSKQTAIAIYKKNYYLDPDIDKLPDLVQPIVFDVAVNSGPKTGIRMLQEVLKDHGYGIGLADGIIGPKTIKAASDYVQAQGHNAVNHLVNWRVKFYKSIISSNPDQKVFEKGWLARAESFRLA